MVRSRLEKRGCDVGPVLCGRHRHRVLAGEVVKERPLGHACGSAEIVHSGGAIALRPDHIDRGVEQLGAGVGLDHEVYIPTGWYVVNLALVAVFAGPRHGLD